ncbi:MAG: gamma carbonic anhydrase family protein [candidate division WOR-3 bacterium]|jgi:carbonic anhydrase/acetyltransferase-like protein (isoleucine patch superfamily)
MFIKLNNKEPQPPFYISEDAVLIGDVRCKENSSIWFKSVLRGDINYIEIGKYSNVQDLSVCHVTFELPCIVGDYVTVGHNAVLHGCKISNYVLIGMGSVILDGVEIGEGSIIAAGTVVKENSKIPPFSLVAGVPGQIKKTLPESVIDDLKKHAESYFEFAKSLKKNGKTILY